MSTYCVRFRQDTAIIQHLLWKLYHIEAGIKSNTEQIEDKNEKLTELRTENAQHEEELKAAKKEVTRAQKEVGRQEKAVKKLEKDLEDKVSNFSHCTFASSAVY